MKKGINIQDFVIVNEARGEVQGIEKPKRTPVPKSPLIVVKRNATYDDLLGWLKSNKPAFLEAYTDTDHEHTKLYKYQVEYLNNPSPFKHLDKARQVGVSYIFACEGLVCALTMPKYTQIFISINQEEASEKIVYARQLYASMDNELPIEIRRPLTIDNKKMLQFEYVDGMGRSCVTRIISHAQREPRGKGGHTFVVLDECAHYMFGDKIYRAALPVATRKGGITLASTPLGKTGIHWDVMEDPLMRKSYSFQTIYWWNCPDFIVEGKFEEAQVNAPLMETKDRVFEYGANRIKLIFSALDIESFRQEYECHHIDESVSYFPMSLIKKCCFNVIKDDIFLADDEEVGDVLKSPIEERNPKIDFSFFDSIDEFIPFAKDKCKGDLYAGFDVGRKHHSAELVIFEDHPSNLVIMRLSRSYKNENFEMMKSELRYLLNKLQIVKMGIDDTGIGSQMAEEMSREFAGICEGITFTNPWKEEVATNIRCLFESQQVAIPDKRNIVGQIHSIKRMVTEHGNLRLDAEKNKDHHGDIFWGIALATSYIKRAFITNLSVGKITSEEESSLRHFPTPKVRIFTPKSLPLIIHVRGVGKFDPRRMHVDD
jgi:phage FluMu gp28-like protein